MTDTAEPLALNGGQPAVTAENPEGWERPVEDQVELVSDLVREGAVSGAGSGLPAEFEETFQKYTDADYCVTVNHGSAALAAAYYAVGVGPGDEVIAPTAGYLGAYEGALHLGARPVFCESDPDTLLADPDDLEARITDRTAAISITHFNGRVCEMDRFQAISEEYDVPLVVDAAHAHGSYWDGEHVATVGDIVCFSLQGIAPYGKPLTGGEGGILTTNDREYYERQLAYCHLHRTGLDDELTMEPYASLDWEALGRKWRAHPLALALATVDFRSLEYRCERRIEYRRRLFAGLDEVPGVRPVDTYDKSDSDGLYGGLRVVYQPDDLGGLPVDRYVEALNEEGVDIDGPGFAYLEHLRYIFREGFDLWGDDRGPLGGEFCGLPPFEGYSEGDFPVTEALDERVLSLPSYIEPPAGYVDEVVLAFEKVAEHHETLTPTH